MRIEAHLRGLDVFKRKMAAIKRATDPEKLMDVAQAIQLDRIRKRFLAQTDTSGRPWPVSQASLKRASTGRDGGTLFDTGTLFHSISPKRISTLKRSIGTNVPYAEEHQRGLFGNPQREFIGISPEDVREMLEVTTLLIKRGIAKNG